MFRELGIMPSSEAVREHYIDLLDGFVFDDLDQEDSKKWQASDIISESFQTIMKDEKDKVALSEAVISLGARILVEK